MPDFGEPSFFDAEGNSISSSAVGNPLLWSGLQYDDESEFYISGGARNSIVSVLKNGGNARNFERSAFKPRTGDTFQRDVGDPLEIFLTRPEALANPQVRMV